MSYELKPIRRVMMGHDEKSRSKVVWDGPAPNVKAPAMGSGRRYTDLWVWTDLIPPLDGGNDDGNLGYDFPGPPRGGHLRVVQADPRPKDDANVNPADIVPFHAPKLIAQVAQSPAYVDAMQKVHTPVEYLSRAPFKEYLDVQESALAAAVTAIGSNVPK